MNSVFSNFPGYKLYNWIRVVSTTHVFIFYPGFFSQTFTIHRTAGEGGGYLFSFSLPLPTVSQTLRHQAGDYCRELASARSQQPDSRRGSSASERKSASYASLPFALQRCSRKLQKQRIFSKNFITAILWIFSTQLFQLFCQINFRMLFARHHEFLVVFSFHFCLAVYLSLHLGIKCILNF